MNKPTIAQKAPYGIQVEAGKTYWWCRCGLSARQPFCDGAHKATTFTPEKYTAAETGQVWFCGCKQTGKAPLCDGTHRSL